MTPLEIVENVASKALIFINTCTLTKYQCFYLTSEVLPWAHHIPSAGNSYMV